MARIRDGRGECVADNRDLEALTGHVAAEEVLFSGESDAVVQLVKLVDTTGSEGARTVTTSRLEQLLSVSARSDTFTGTGNGTAVNVATTGRSRFGMAVKGTGAAASAWTVNLQVSLDGTNYATLLSHANSDGDGAAVWVPTPSPALYFRTNVSALTLGSATNIVVTIIGMP